jgi:hypothetical protein
MANVLLAFTDVDRAKRVAAQLEPHLPSGAVTLHVKNATPGGSLAATVDEAVVSGGMLHNLYDLFQGVFEWGASPHDASHYEEIVRKGGAVLSIEASTEQEREAVDEIGADAGLEQRTPWSDR